MSPTLRDGDFVCALKWPQKWLRVGHVVVVKSDKYGVIVKRVDKVHNDGTFTIAGDNTPHSVSTAEMGHFYHAQLLGKVIFHSST